jgi:hypothetical protein
MMKIVPISDAYSSPLWRALIHSGIAAILSVLALDQGQTAVLSAIGLIIFWGGTTVIIFRRPQNPTSFDLDLIRWGCLPFILVFQVAMYCSWHLRGLI